LQKAAGGVPEPDKADLAGCSKEELVCCLHWKEAEKLAALVQCCRLIQGVNWQLQEHLREVCKLKAVNGRLQVENCELHDFCCFLDEDLLKVKCLAHHWQLFGNHAVQVLYDEVASCLHKLAGLEGLLTPLSPLHRSGATVNGVSLQGWHLKRGSGGKLGKYSGFALLPRLRCWPCRHIGKVEQSQCGFALLFKHATTAAFEAPVP
uniref:Coiled-coil domain containing 85B n=1 Tax=Pseudonaja textilis TaxID=8673 RepID=A0A670ZEX2_PSETE